MYRFPGLSVVKRPCTNSCPFLFQTKAPRIRHKLAAQSEKAHLNLNSKKQTSSLFSSASLFPFVLPARSAAESSGPPGQWTALDASTVKLHRKTWHVPLEFGPWNFQGLRKVRRTCSFVHPCSPHSALIRAQKALKNEKKKHRPPPLPPSMFPPKETPCSPGPGILGFFSLNSLPLRPPLPLKLRRAAPAARGAAPSRRSRRPRPAWRTPTAAAAAVR